MCLVDTKQFRCSEKKIPIWKVVWKDSEGFHSPYQDYKLNRINQITNIKNQSCNRSHFDSTSGISYYLFEEGFFHTYITEDSAIKLVDILSTNSTSPSYTRSHLEIVEGYIPEDTRYAIDEDGTSICARKMILNI